MDEIAYFMIESGKPLEMVKQHITERNRVWNEVRRLAKELSIEDVYTDRLSGVLSGVVFRGPIHPDFAKTKKRNGVSYPKKNTEWKRRFQSQTGYRNPSEWVSSEFGIPGSVSYSNGESTGWHAIGNPLTECGFLYLGEDGPYAMWAPDVPAIVAEYTAKGYTIEEPAASFKFNIEGCRRIEQEEWKILVLQHELEQKKAAKQGEQPC